MKTTVSEMKNTLDEISNGLNWARVKTNERKDIAIGSIQNKTQEKKIILKNY